MSPDRDLTIETALADPVIRAAMRADRVSPRDLEAMLRATAQRLDQRQARSFALLPKPVPPAGRSLLLGFCCA